MLEIFADTLSGHRGYDSALCRKIVRETALGTMLLQEMDGIDSDEIVQRVAHPGGSSEAGVNYLKSVLPEIYIDMLKNMSKW